MTDIVQKALIYRRQMLDEISRIDEFLRMGEKLLRANYAALAAAESGPAAGAERTAPQHAPRTAAPALNPAAAPTPSAASALAAAPDPSMRPPLAFRGAIGDSDLPRRREIA